MEIHNITPRAGSYSSTGIGVNGDARKARGAIAGEQAKSTDIPSGGDTISISGDTVSVSQDALLLTEARRIAQNTEDVRAEKVQGLRMQVEEGTYTIDSMRIAAGLVREEPLLFQV